MKIYKKILLIIFFILLTIFLNKNVYAFDVVDNTGNSTNTYTIPDVSAEYQDYLNTKPYLIKKYNNYITIHIVKDANAYFYLSGGSTCLTGNFYIAQYNGSKWDYSIQSFSGTNWASSQNIYFNADIYTDINKTDYYYKMPSEPEYVFPYIADTDEVLSNLNNIDDILVFPGSLSKSCLPLKLSIYKYNKDSTIEGVVEITLDTNSPYYLYIIENPDDYWWEIPTELFKKSLQNGQEYHYALLGANEYNDFSILRSVIYQGTTYIPPTDEELQTDAILNQTNKIEEQTNAIINQTEKIEEQTEVSKNIFQRIGDILSYINPLSENFFAYKLIDLLIDALKSLFVPEERFPWCIF